MIVMTVFNEEKHIKNAISSILNQSYRDFNLHIVNNGSSDNTGKIADLFAKTNNNVTVTHLHKNDINEVFKIMLLTKNKFFMAAAGHDIYRQNFIKDCMKEIENNDNVILAYPLAEWISETDDIIGNIPGSFDTRGSNCPLVRSLIVALSLVEAYQVYGIFRTDAYMHLLKKYIDKKIIGLDHVLLTELASIGHFALVNEHLFYLRRTKGWGDPQIYIKKHGFEDCNKMQLFLDMLKAYLNIAYRFSDRPDYHLFRQALFNSTLLRYNHILTMLNLSLNDLLNNIDFTSLNKVVLNTVGKKDSLNKTNDIPTKISKGKIASSPSNSDYTSIQSGSEFEIALKKYISSYKPRKIIETGTYLGTGTTRIIASTLRDLEIKDSLFITIECNPDNYEQALKNIKNEKLLNYVKPILGLSIPRNIVPTKEDIYKSTVLEIPDNEIFIDHNPEQRTDLYYNETDFENIEDNLIDYCLNLFKGEPDFIVLDSGGHIGFIEFQYILHKIKKECIICLDDINHIKHYNSFKFLQNDKRFTVLHISNEKFGFCIAKFDPILKNKQNILWIRTDSIGDCILSFQMIEKIKNQVECNIDVVCQTHISELYKNHYINNTIQINSKQVILNEKYRNNLISIISKKNYDLTINSTFSRDIVSDFISINSGAKKIITQDGDLSNISETIQEQNNRHYSFIIQPKHSNTEISRNNNFINSLGIQSETINPEIFLSKSDKLFAHNFFKTNSLNSEKTIVLFAGAQHISRIYENYGLAINEICQKNDYTVIALGSEKDFNINQLNLDAINAKTINLCGKLSIRESAAIIKNCYFAIGAETGLAHIACAVGTRNIILLGGGHFGRFMPYSSLTATICLPLECYNCNWSCKYDSFYCINDINTDVIKYAFISEIDKKPDAIRIYTQSHLLWNSAPDKPKWKIFNKNFDTNIFEIIPVAQNLINLQNEYQK